MSLKYRYIVYFTLEFEIDSFSDSPCHCQWRVANLATVCFKLGLPWHPLQHDTASLLSATIPSFFIKHSYNKDVYILFTYRSPPHALSVPSVSIRFLCLSHSMPWIATHNRSSSSLSGPISSPQSAFCTGIYAPSERLASSSSIPHLTSYPMLSGVQMS